MVCIECIPNYRKVGVCWQMKEEQVVQKVWWYDEREIAAYSRDRVEQELLALFPPLKAKGLRLELSCEDSLVEFQYWAILPLQKEFHAAKVFILGQVVYISEGEKPCQSASAENPNVSIIFLVYIMTLPVTHTLSVANLEFAKQPKCCSVM